MSDLALYDAQAQLNSMHERFNALATVAGREMPQYLKPAYTVPLTVGLSALAAASEAKFKANGMIANAVLAGVAYGVGMLSGENADLRAGAYMVATGLGSAAASVAAHQKVEAMLAQTKQAPPPSSK